MRQNLDPDNEFSEDELLRALNKVQMSSTVHGLDGGLDAGISELSDREAFLVGLARVLLR